MKDKTVDERQQIQLAARILHITEEEAVSHSNMIDHSTALYCYNPHKGGGAIIVSDDGSFLYAASCINPDEHKKEFLLGRRTSVD